MDTEKKVFLYKQVYQDLRDKINSNYYKSGDLLPSEREVGEIYHVDRTTVRKAFSLLVDEGLVEKRPGKGSVVLQPSVKNAASPSYTAEAPKAIAFLLPTSTRKSDRITVPFYSELFYNIEKECKSLGYTLVYSSLNDHEDFEHFLSMSTNISGIIFVSNIAPECIAKTVERKIPCVLLNSSNPQIPSVLSDGYAGTYAAVEYLLQCGHKNIAVLDGISEYVSSRERLKGVNAALKDHGLTLKKEYYVCAGTWEADGGYAATKELLANCSLLPTAIISFNDRLASGAMQAISHAGLSVPGDISIFGYDNSDHAKYSIPKMSSIEINIPWMSKAALWNLLNQISYNEMIPSKITIPVSLVLGDSVKDLTTASAPEQDEPSALG